MQGDRVEYKKKFQGEFFAETIPPKTPRPGKALQFLSYNIDDWVARFKGNNDDNFRIGISFGASFCKLYTEFNKSEIIIASPLGLKLSIEGNSMTHISFISYILGGDVDFLSSIELVVVDGVENSLMQNWEHLSFLFKHLNEIPKEYHGADVTRIRLTFIDGQAKYLR